jgi:hypothetical protein
MRLLSGLSWTALTRNHTRPVDRCFMTRNLVFVWEYCTVHNEGESTFTQHLSHDPHRGVKLAKRLRYKLSHSEHDRAGWCGGNPLGLYSEGGRSESWLDIDNPRVFPASPSVPPGKSRDNTSIGSNLFHVINPIILSFDAVGPIV